MNIFSRLFRSPVNFASAIALAAASIGAIAALPQPVAAQSSADLNRAVAALRAISTMKADFVQTDRNGQRISGKLTLKRPGRIRFQYQKGVPLLIVSDGKALTLIDYEVSQVQRWPIGNSPLGALLDPKRDVAKFGRVMSTANPEVVSIQVKDPRHPEYGVITMIFRQDAAAPGGMELVSWVALDSQNKRTTVRLSNHSYGMAIPDSAFGWKDPRGGPSPRR